MRRAIVWMAALALLVMALGAPTSSAAVQLVETDTEEFGATTITWDSSFEDLDYRLGDPVTFTVTWTVDDGTAEFEDYALRFPEFTPTDPFDPADGTLDGATNSDTADGGEVDVSVTFTELHFSEEEGVDMGNAHMSLHLMVDEDGNGEVDTLVQLGVNLHVEDPTATESDGEEPGPGTPPGEDGPTDPPVGDGDGPGIPEDVDPGPPFDVGTFVRDLLNGIFDGLRSLFE